MGATAEEGQGPGHRRAVIFGVWVECRPLFSCCVLCGVQTPEAELLVGGSGAKSPEAETLSSLGREMKAANLPAFNILKPKRKN